MGQKSLGFVGALFSTTAPGERESEGKSNKKREREKREREKKDRMRELL
jgi:hypothetical protein